MRNALARRLQKNISDASNSSKQDAAGLSSTQKLPPQTTTPSTADAFDVMTVRVSGFLYKYSSGHLARWQKRFFILEGGRLSYFKKSPTEKDEANKTFSMRKIKSVSSKDSLGADDREFGLLFANGKTYQIRAPTNEDMRKWVASLRGAIAYFEQSGIDVDQHADDDAALSDADGMTSANGSVMSENRPPDSPTHSSEHKLSSRLQGLIPRRESLTGVIHAAGHGLSSIKHAVIPSASLGLAPVDTSMLEVEIDPDQLDKNFEEWFYFVQSSSASKQGVQIQRDIKMSHITDAVGKANQHLWSTLASLPRGSEVKLEEAVGRAKSRMGGPEAVERATIIVEEYLLRMSKYVQRSVDIRSASMPRLGHGRTTLGLGSDVPAPPANHWISELPQLMDCITRVQGFIEKLFGRNGEKCCLCCYCDPSGVAMLKLERQHGGKKQLVLPPVSCSQAKWRKSLRSLLQRIGGELEVGLIEELQNLIQSAELAWESHPRATQPTDDPVFGPCPQQHPLFDDMFVNPTPGVKSSPPKILMSSFAPAFVQAAQTRCLNTASQWMAAYSSSARLISEHSSSALVASLNSVWRQFKRVATNATDRAHREESRKYTESIRNSRDDALRSSASSQGGGGSPSNHRRRSSSVGSAAAADMNDLVFDLEHLISFSNECVLISRFCAKTWSNGVSAKFTPDVFLTCMDGLASGFLATAVDVCHSIVSIHYLPRVKFDLNKMFHAKNLSQNHSTPMAYGKIITDQFVGSVDVLSPLLCIKEGIVSLVGPALMRAYMGALFRNKPKLKTFKTVPEMVRGDIETFKDTFVAGFKVPSICVEQTLTVADALLQAVNDRNRINYSIHFNTLSQLIGSKPDAFSVIQSVVKMREHEWKSSSDKKEIASILSSIKSGMSVAEPEDETETPKEPSVVKRLPKGAVVVTLGVGELKVGWKFDE